MPNTVKIIALALPDIPGVWESPYFSRIVAGVEEALAGSDVGWKILFGKEGAPSWTAETFSPGSGVDGLILPQWFRFFEGKESLNAVEIPCVLVNDYEEGVAVPSFEADNVGGGRKAAQCLFEAGHRDVVCLKGPAWCRDTSERWQGFQDFFVDQGVPCGSDRAVVADFHDEGIIARALDRVLSRAPRPTAIFAGNDSMALIVLEELKQRGLRCPEDVSLVGFDDHPQAAYTSPALTTIRMSAFAIARAAALALRDRLCADASRAVFSGRTFLPVDLVERASVVAL